MLGKEFSTAPCILYAIHSPIYISLNALNMSASMATNNDVTENSDMGIDIPTASNKPPGIAAFRRAKPDSDLAALAISLLMIVQESKVLKLHSGSKEWTTKWKEVFCWHSMEDLQQMDSMTRMEYSAGMFHGHAATQLQLNQNHL